MAKEKKQPHKVVMTEGKREIIKSLLSEYDIQFAQDIQEALKDLLGGTIKEMMEAEMEDHLGYEKSERSDNDDYRNSYKSKTVKSSIGEVLEKTVTLFCLHNPFTLKYGSPRFNPQALASLLSAIMIPSLLDKTATGLFRKSGR